MNIALHHHRETLELGASEDNDLKNSSISHSMMPLMHIIKKFSSTPQLDLLWFLSKHLETCSQHFHQMIYPNTYASY